MKVHIWRCPQTRAWLATRRGTPIGWANPLAFGGSPADAYWRYCELLQYVVKRQISNAGQRGI